MAASRRFTDLRVWQEAHTLALLVYKLTRNFPKDEQFALTNQLRRAATSVPSNIAEGFNRFSLKEKVQYYSISLGFDSEVQSQMLLARDLQYLEETDYERSAIATDLVHKQLAALIKSIRKCLLPTAYGLLATEEKI